MDFRGLCVRWAVTHYIYLQFDYNQIFKHKMNNIVRK